MEAVSALLLGGPAYWWWIGLCLILLLLEMATMSLFLLWPGVAAGLVALLAFVFPEMGLAVQIVAFGVLSVALTYLGRSYFKGQETIPSDRPKLNRRGEQMIGRRVSAIHDFENGEGAVRVDDGQWTARLVPTEGAGGADEAPVRAGETLVIQEVEGSLVRVARP